MKIMITDKLTIDQQQELLKALFGFDYVNLNDDANDAHWVLLDEEGEEFYACKNNDKFDFSTLAGIFSYTAYRGKNQGYADCQYAMRKVLGIQ